MLNTFGERVKIFSASAHIPLLVIKLGGVGWMAGPACVLPNSVLNCMSWPLEGLGYSVSKTERNVANQRSFYAICISVMY